MAPKRISMDYIMSLYHRCKENKKACLDAANIGVHNIHKASQLAAQEEILGEIIVDHT